MKKQRVIRRGGRELVVIFPVDELDIYEQIDRLICCISQPVFAFHLLFIFISLFDLSIFRYINAS